jgi:hypothetical protein
MSPPYMSLHVADTTGPSVLQFLQDSKAAFSVLGPAGAPRTTVAIVKTEAKRKYIVTEAKNLVNWQ